MASIQQSLNQLLGAVAGATTMGSYMYRQSGTYQDILAERKARKLEQVAEDVDKTQRNLIREAGRTQTEIENRGEDPEESITFQAQKNTVREIATERENLLREAYRSSPSTSRLKKYAQSKKRGISMDMFDRERAEQAEKSALERQENEINRQREQEEALAIRTSILRGTPAEHLLYPKEDKK